MTESVGYDYLGFLRKYGLLLGMVPMAGFEPATIRVGGGSSIHLSYMGEIGLYLVR